ncbi:alpha-L-fucosidase [uncultured Mucilaginibacter sp.]|uniref:alpha-L-fucosidase n=1 Tax=uncultured Mucilaginibacter sp. TaxID=797541 RepID=UPI0025F4A7CA|nr:alpha-L-fucosidase [uncultured Mucilaginibacter sp.]
MKRRSLIKGTLTGAASLYLAKLQAQTIGSGLAYDGMAKGPFLPSWNSLEQYQVPDWFRDAKFGLWAHWGPQCQPEYGDWYAKGMYEEGSSAYKYHLKTYGHPSKFGFKDVINEWKADKWDPAELVSLYKEAGAKYFVALANHHDNFDLYPNKYQKWNSTNIGPKKDLIKGWEKAARDNGLRFGVSVHAAHAWTWYEPSQGADKTGPMAGVHYDGNIQKGDGKGKWWEGYDPQELYSQRHPLSVPYKDGLQQWDWKDGASIPSKAYNEKFLKRTLALLDNYDPDLVYFDDTALPLWPVSDVGLKIAAHMYNNSLKKHGKMEAVITGKILDEQQRKCIVWDIERGHSNRIEPLPWQTCTCIGNWHYDKRVYEGNKYKSAATVVHMLADVVSKNGNLLLSVPVKGNGTIDEKERAIVQQITAWTKQNGEAIYGTRPWKVFGEGPAMENVKPLKEQGYNEGTVYKAGDIRFTTKNNALYAILLGWPQDGNQINIKSVGAGGKVEKVTLIANGSSLKFEQSGQGLKVQLPAEAPGTMAYVLKIEGAVV